MYENEAFERAHEMIGQLNEALLVGDRERASRLAGALGIGPGPSAMPANAARGGGGSYLDFARAVREAAQVDGLIREALIPLTGSISSSTSNGEVTADYRIPAGEHLALREMRGLISISDLSAETLAIATVGNPTFSERLLMKASNCRFDLVVSDDKRQLVENSTKLELAAITTMLGGIPVFMNPPEIVLSGLTLRATFTLTDQAADVIGASTRYGILLIGTFVKRTGKA